MYLTFSDFNRRFVGHFLTPYNYRLEIITVIFSEPFKYSIIVDIDGIHSLWNIHIYSSNIRYRSFTCWEIVWNVEAMLKLAPACRKLKTLNLILVSIPWRTSRSLSFPTETPPRRLPPSLPRHLDIVQLTQKIIKSRLSWRFVQNLWINEILDFSRIFFGLTLNHVILQNMNIVSLASGNLQQYLIQFFDIRLYCQPECRERLQDSWA